MVPLSIMKLRNYQTEAKEEIRHAWAAGARVVCCTMPTGSGKTVLFASIVREEPGAVCVIAHRQELVQQISLALAREGVRHRIVAPRNTVRRIMREHLAQLGRSSYDPSSQVAVAGVDTLIRQDPGPWGAQVRLWIQDECHHILAGNKWGKAAALFPAARGLGVTATPCRTDGKGLGRHADGLIDTLIVGPTMRELIKRGFLCDYRIFAPVCSDLDLSDVAVSAATGDYVPQQLQVAIDKSHVVGDVVTHYLRLARGKRGVTFANSVATAARISAEYCAAGVPSAVVSAKTPDAVRAECVRRLASGDLLQLCNVDLFGEGFDLPAIECVSFARPTESYALFVQQFGRSLRPLEGKREAIIIDHVGNTIKHGLPDAVREWSLDARVKRARKAPDEIPLTNCTKCFRVYERIYRVCPFCGQAPEIRDRTDPKQVDGDLVELTPETLARLRGDADRIVGPVRVPQGLAPAAVGGLRKQHEMRKETQLGLRKAMEYWMGYRKAEGRNMSEAQRLFFHRFGVDVLTAQGLGRPEAVELGNRVCDDIGRSHGEYARRISDEM